LSDASRRLVQKLWSYCNAPMGGGARSPVLAQEIADDLRAALTQIEDILGDLERRAPANGGTRREASA
jgi:hypothetical protein